MRRYVILTHDHPFLHWDLMLESGSALRTWRLVRPPEPEAGVPAEALGDHRMAYLDYEGPVSGDRGYVTRWDAGMFDVVSESVAEVRVRLAGEKLSGELSLARLPAAGWVCRYWPTGAG